MPTRIPALPQVASDAVKSKAGPDGLSLLDLYHQTPVVGKLAGCAMLPPTALSLSQGPLT